LAERIGAPGLGAYLPTDGAAGVRRAIVDHHATGRTDDVGIAFRDRVASLTGPDHEGGQVYRVGSKAYAEIHPGHAAGAVVRGLPSDWRGKVAYDG